MKPAFAQSEVCGPTCSAWAALTSGGPAIALGYGGEYLAWKGQGGSYIWFTDGGPTTDWATQAKVGGAGGSWYAETNVAPALTAFGMGYALAWKGQSGTTIWYSILSGSSWGSQNPIANTETDVAPALASSPGMLYLAWTTPSNGIEYLTYSATTSAWSTVPIQVPGAVTTLSPAVTVYNGVLYFAWTTASNTIEYISYNGLKWSSIGPVTSDLTGTPATTDLAPTLTTGSSYVGGPFLAWTAPSGDIYLANGDASTWSGSLVNNEGLMTNLTPALLLLETSGGCENFYSLYLAFTNEANGAIIINQAAYWNQILKSGKSTCTQ